MRGCCAQRRATGGGAARQLIDSSLQRLVEAPSVHGFIRDAKICYLELPARNIDEASAFHSTLFGWQIRQRGDGEVAFDDSVGQVSGTFAP